MLALAVTLALPGPAQAGPREQPGGLASITATAETPAVEGDDADDPAIWVDPRNRSASLVIGALKNEGLGVYDLAGRLLQQLPVAAAPAGAEAPSRFNNVDLVHGFRLGGRTVDLAVVSDRGLDQVRAYRIDGGRRAPLVDVSATTLPLVFATDPAQVADQATAYGLATWSAGRHAYVYVTRRHSLPLAQLELVDDHGRVGYRPAGRVTLPGSFRLPGGTTWSPCEDPGEGAQSEAMVVDPRTRTLYVAQEDVGIWRIPVPFGRGKPRLVDRVKGFGVPATFDEATEECVAGADPGFGGRHLTADVEGLQVVPGRGGASLLLASSQGDDTFAVYDRAGTHYRGGFALVDGPSVDGSTDCDGVAVSTADLGPAFPGGLAVIQDGDDDGPDGGSNFKFVPWPRIARALHL